MFVSLVSSFLSLPLLWVIDKVKGRHHHSVLLDSLLKYCHSAVCVDVESDVIGHKQ